MLGRWCYQQIFCGLGWLSFQLGFQVPFVGDVSHQEGVVEGDASWGEVVGIVEVRGFDRLHFEWGGLPVGDFKKESVQAVGIGTGRVADTAVFEEVG